MTLQTNFTTAYDAKVKQLYQHQMKLKGKTRMERVKGDKHRFPVINEGVSRVANPGAQVVYGDNDDISAVALVENYESVYLIPRQHANKVAYNPKDEYSMKASMAIGRRCDQVTIDALETGVADKMKIEADYGSSSGNIGLAKAKINRAAALLNAAGCPMENRYLAISASGVEDLFGITEYTSRDFNSLESLRDGKVVPFLGFQIISLAEFGQLDGLPKGSTSGDSQGRSYYAWHIDAVGTAVNEEISSEIDWIPERQSWQAYTRYSAGAVVIDPRGVVEIGVNESVLDLPNINGE